VFLGGESLFASQGGLATHHIGIGTNGPASPHSPENGHVLLAMGYGPYPIGLKEAEDWAYRDSQNPVTRPDPHPKHG